MPPFNATMLAATPTPEPEVRSQAEDAHMDNAPMESDVDCLMKGWTQCLLALDGCVAAIPDMKPELMEDQEAWMREWQSVMTKMNACSTRADQLDVALDLSERDHGLLKEGRKGFKEAEALVKGWKAKAIESTPEAPGKRAVAVADMGEPRMGGRMSVPKAPRCNRCNASNIPCGGTSGKRCPPCDVSKKSCSFAAKRRGAAAAAPRARKALPKRAGTKGSAKEPASSPAVDDEGDTAESDMDVEITGERLAEDNVVRGSRTIPIRAVNPLPSGPAPEGKGKARDLEAELEEAEAENARLKQENARLRNSILIMRQHARAQQADLLLLSNKLFAMSQEWADVESRLTESF